MHGANLDLHLTLDGSGPRVRQLERALRLAIVSGQLQAGQRLPATRRLALQLGLARNTVLTAFEQLSAEGWIRGRVGSGSYVAPVDALPVRGALPPPVPPRLSAFGARAQALAPARPESPAALRWNLGYGTPSVPPAIQSAWRRALVRAADDTAFDYPPVQGLLELRQALAGYLHRRRGLDVQADDLLIVGGTQQGIDLCARVLLDPGDLALVEDPAYQGLRLSFAACGARVEGVPTDTDGLDPAHLRGSAARLVAVTPSHQFPTGALLSLSRRLALLEWAGAHDAYVLEDDYDGEFRYGGAPLAALKSLDRQQRVIYLGSFSRVLFPAIRLGYLVLPPALREAFGAARWLADRGSPAIEQRALAALIASGRFERLLLRSARRLDERRRALLAALNARFAGQIQISGAHAGMHLCVRWPALPAACEPAVLAAAAALGLGLGGITRYCERPPACLSLLLGYAHLPPADLAQAVDLLALALARGA